MGRKRFNDKPALIGFIAGSVIFIVTCISTWLLYTQNNNLQFQLLREEISNIARISALEINVEALKKITKPEHTNNAHYKNIITPLVKIHNTVANILYLYVMKEVDGKVYYILDTVNDERTKRKGPAVAGVVMAEYEFDPTNELFSDWLPSLREGKVYIDPTYYLDEGELILGASVPLFDKQGNYYALLGVDYDVSLYDERQKKILNISYAVLFTALILSVLIGWRVYIISKNLDKTHLKLYHQANTDFLTGAYNRRYFFSQVSREMDRSFRHLHPLSMILFDIDYFKKINDTYGHLSGDEILKGLVQTIKSNMRAYDLIARIGGEEFAILLHETNSKGAVTFAKQLQQKISEMQTQSKSGVQMAFTISIGICEFQKGLELDSWIHKTDEAVYKAKDAGRNRIVCV